MRTMKWVIVMLAAALGPGAWAGTGEPPGPTTEEPTPGHQGKLPPVSSDCIYFRTIHSWRALDPYNLIVWFNNRHTARHIELETACYSARFVDTIAFTSLNNHLCAYSGESVIVGDSRCPIGAIHRVNEDEIKVLIEKFDSHYKRRKPKADHNSGQ